MEWTTGDFRETKTGGSGEDRWEFNSVTVLRPAGGHLHDRAQKI